MTDRCQRPPKGWTCSRTPGHDGPCAARRKAHWWHVPGVLPLLIVTPAMTILTFAALVMNQ